MRRTSFCTLGLVCLAAATASAQPRDRDARLDLAAEADLHFELGVSQQRGGDCLAALEHYLLSNRLAYNKNVVFNIARCYEQLDRFDQAYRYYSDYLDEELDEADRRAAREAFRRVRRRVALVRVTSTPPGATIYVDRLDLGARGRTPRTLAVAAGSTRVILEREGYESASATVSAAVGREASIELALEPVLATVLLTGGPRGAQVRTDDPTADPLGTVPGPVHVVPGHRTLLVSHEGYQTARLEVDVEPRQTVRRSVDLERETGSVVVDVRDRGALIEIDGEAVGFTPAVLPDVPSGRHTIRISRPGFRAYEDHIVVEPNAQTGVEVRLRLDQEVQAASRQTQSVSEAPASVTLIAQEELRAFGFQTVWDALGGLRGIYQTDDRSYASLGFRGFSQPQDYGNRLLVLTDGHVMNDDMLGSSSTGFDARSDLLDVERIEVVRGPGSALYGTNAFFGVINVVTRDRDTLLRPHASIATEGVRSARLRVGGGTRFSRDVGLWASAGGILSQGEDLLLPEIATAPDGYVRGADGFYTASAAARGWAGDFTLEGSYHRRRKQIPTGAFDTLVGDPRTHNTDSRGFAELRWEPRFSPEVAMSARAFLDYYEYEGDFANTPRGTPPMDPGVTRDHWLGYWVGAEARLLLAPLTWLRVTAGAEVRGSIVADLTGENDLDGRYLDEVPRFFAFGGFVIADVLPIPELSIQLGGRYDFASAFDGGEFSPRAAVIVRPWETGIIKLIFGSAYRAPSIYELRYHDDGVSQIAPDSLRPERIWTGELELTQRIEEETSAIVSVFYNYIEDAVTTEFVPGMPDVLRYANQTVAVQTLGGELELRREWREGWMVAGSYSYQRTRLNSVFSDSNANRLPNSPEHLLGLRAAAPLIEENLTVGVRLRVESARLGVRFAADGSRQLVEGDVPVLGDLVLSGEFRSIGLSYAFGVRNLFDWRYGLPSGEDIAVPFVPQSGRTLFLQTTVQF